jgi:imidazolonepropionase-like amidohydrolase
MPGRLDVIKPGACADINVVEGDPLHDLSIMEDRSRIRLIMKNGEIFKNTF